MMVNRLKHITEGKPFVLICTAINRQDKGVSSSCDDQGQVKKPSADHGFIWVSLLPISHCYCTTLSPPAKAFR